MNMDYNLFDTPTSLEEALRDIENDWKYKNNLF